VLAPYRARPRAVPLIKKCKVDVVFKILTFPKKIIRQKKLKETKIIFFVFWARQGLTLVLRILIKNEKSGLRSSLKIFEKTIEKKI